MIGREFEFCYRTPAGAFTTPNESICIIFTTRALPTIRTVPTRPRLTPPKGLSKPKITPKFTRLSTSRTPKDSVDLVKKFAA